MRNKNLIIGITDRRNLVGFFMPENMKGMIFMEQRNELKDLLYEKMSKEQDNFIEKLKHSSPEEIISKAYEKIMRDDIMMLFDDDFLDTKQMKALLKLEYPLSACYDEWLKNDCSIWICSVIRLMIFRKTLHETKNRRKRKSVPSRNDKYSQISLPPQGRLF